MRNRGRRLWAAGAVIVGIAAILAALPLIVDKESAGYILSALVVLLTAASLLLMWSDVATRRGNHPVGTAQDALAHAVDQFTYDEAQRWQLTDPTPLSVEWRVTDRMVMDSDSSVARVPAPARIRAWSWRGISSKVDELVEEFCKLPRRRLVVIGRPGSGKTSLAVLLVLALLRRRKDHPDQPVPIMLPLGSWNPTVENLHGWIARRLAEDHPNLRDERQYGRDAPATLVRRRLVLPILDGLDEVAEGLRAEAVTEINRTLVEDQDAIVVTCRAEEFEHAVLDPNGDVVTGAYVIEAEPLRLECVKAYLEAAISPAQRQRWQPVLERLANRPESPLGAALQTPLVAWLLRTVYADRDADPAVLLDNDRFPDAAAIENHLLDLLPEVLLSHDARTRAGQGGKSPRRWDADSAQRWLQFLAAHMSRLETREFRWWQLHRSVPGLDRRAGRGAVIAVLGTLVAGLLFAPTTWIWLDREPAGLVIGALFGLGPGLASGTAAALAPGNVRLDALASNPPKRSRWRQLTRTALAGLASGGVGGLALAIVVGIVYRWAGGSDVVLGAIGAGFMFATLTGVPYGLASGVAGLLSPGGIPNHSPIHLRQRRRWALLRRSLRSGLRRSLLPGVVIGPVLGLAFFVPAATLIGFSLGPSLLGDEAATATDEELATAMIVGALVFALLGALWGLMWGVVWGTLSALTTGVALGVTGWMRSPIASDRAAQARSVLRADRGAAVLTTLMLAVGFALALALPFVVVTAGISMVSEEPMSAVAIIAIAYFGAVTGSLLGAFSGAWPYYLLARIWLALRRQLPWPLMGFLDDLHRLRILRQVGATYQFAHAHLHDRLGGRTPTRYARRNARKPK